MEFVCQRAKACVNTSLTPRLIKRLIMYLMNTNGCCKTAYSFKCFPMPGPRQYPPSNVDFVRTCGMSLSSLSAFLSILASNSTWIAHSMSWCISQSWIILRLPMYTFVFLCTNTDSKRLPCRFAVIYSTQGEPVEYQGIPEDRCFFSVTP